MGTDRRFVLVMMIGRWEHIKTARLYVVRGKEELTSAQLSADAAARCTFYKDVLGASFGFQALSSQ